MDTFSIFLNNLYSFLINNEIPDGRGVIKKPSDNLSNGDLSFPLKISNWKRYLTDPDKIQRENIIETDDECKDLIRKSKQWPLEIEKCSIVNDYVVVHLNKISCIKKVFSDVIKLKENYGSILEAKQKYYCLKCDINETPAADLTQLRIKLIKNITINLLKCFGHDVSDRENIDMIKIHFVTGSQCSDNHVDFLCGPVIDAITCKKSTKCAEEFYRKRELDMRLLAEHKYGVRVTSMPSWRELFVALGNAAVTVEMLQVKPSNPLRINLNDASDLNNKGASFIMYNCARITAIIKKFEGQINEGLCTLPNLDEIDFSLLNQPEEWELVYCYILHYPSVIKSCILDVDRGHINPQHLCSFLFRMCSKFSVYYRRIRILTSTRSHMLPTLYARIYLLKCLQTVLHNALRILNIQPINQM